MFDRWTNLLSDSDYEWPSDGTLQRQLLRNADCYLETDGRSTPIRSFRSIEAADRGVGRPHPHALYGHAWNWYCDANANLVLSFDLTGADRLLDSGRALTIFNEGFDGYRWTNVSSFLATLFVWYAREDGPLYRWSAIEKYLDDLVDPTSPYGKALLYNLCHQTIIDDHVRNRLVEDLEDRGFHDDYPAWRIRLAAGTALLTMDSPAEARPAQTDLLEAMV